MQLIKSKFSVYVLDHFLFHTGSNAAILSPHSSIYDLCPGDRVVIVCNVSGANLNWELQMSNLILQISYDIIAENNVDKYIPPNSPAINGLTTTLLDYHTTSPLYLTSSLEFNVSDDFVNATVVCNNERRYLAINSKLFIFRVLNQCYCLNIVL